MSGSLQRRIDRLSQRAAHQPGRMVVVEIDESFEHDAALLDATLVTAGVVQTEQDLVVKIKRFASIAGQPSCALLAIHTLAHSSARRPS